MDRGKAAALVTMAALSFICPAIERAMTGRVELLSGYGLAETGLTLIALFWWFHLDKAEHDYRAGKLMNAGVLIFAAIALRRPGLLLMAPLFPLLRFVDAYVCLRAIPPSAWRTRADGRWTSPTRRKKESCSVPTEQISQHTP